ncbi:hypothetical protein [Microbulbifer sp. THAF38]|uniref:hypothetical protein n=1 Tax=Microbulbifer sp. THAF38 TaxID=2587856 RepID=UPI0020A3A5BB|nr:hypothetical protein [Microbulbifer sp. THAF38]
METGKQKIPVELLPALCEAVGITLAEVHGVEKLHHFSPLPFPPFSAPLHTQPPEEWQLYIQRNIENIYRLWRSRK